ncbi:MAG: U32 family peptidase [Lachnospiraceae bacterium]|nr:U32 family peptidase [Lachnospiraceae bacterium]
MNMKQEINGKKRKPELLAPAGNFEGFLGCINAGCDAVYIGGNRYGARAYAENFSDEEIVKAIKYAHLFDIKVYLTVNTLIKQRELSDVVAYVKPFADAGLDAFIVQDIGLISLLKNAYPETEIHVSTQGFSTGINSVKYYKELGATRVVLARELTLNEIKAIKDSVDIELETFIHGAMCYSFSGQCLFSSSLGGRSGNRGRCAGPCRLEYASVIDSSESEAKYLLSMKDQCTVSILPELIDAGIDSLKIEGRMKKPEYTAFVTSVYRKYIDEYYLYGKSKYSVKPKDFTALKNMYMRSEIGTGYYNQINSAEMISIASPSYSGSDDSMMKYTREKFLSAPRKKSISGYFSASKADGIAFSVFDSNRCVTVSDTNVSQSINKPATAETVRKQLCKLGDTPFTFDELTIDMEDDLFLPVSTLNGVRRRAIEELLNEF